MEVHELFLVNSFCIYIVNVVDLITYLFILSFVVLCCD